MMFGINAGDSLNPVFLKEVRQNLSNRSFIMITACIIALELLMMILFYTTDQFSLSHSLSRDFKENAAFFLYLLNASSVILASIITATRWNSEAGVEGMDPAISTPFSPFKIILGRSMSSWLLCFYLLLAASPFLFILLASESITIAHYLVFLSWLTMVVQAMVFGFSSPIKDVKKKYPQVWAMLYIIVGSSPLSFVLSSGKADYCILMWAFTALIFLSAVATTTPYVLNIARPLKSALVGISLLLLILGWTDRELFGMWGFWMLITGAATMLFGAAERLDPTFRMQLDSPRNPILRFLNIFISSGVISSLLLGALLCGIGVAVLKSDFNLILVLIFFAFYAETVILLRVYLKLQYATALASVIAITHILTVFSYFYDFRFALWLVPWGNTTPDRLYIGLTLVAIATIALLPQIIKTFALYMEKPQDKIS